LEGKSVIVDLNFVRREQPAHGLFEGPSLLSKVVAEHVLDSDGPNPVMAL